MAIRMPRITHAKNILRWALSLERNVASTIADVPKGYLAVYVGEQEKKRFVIPTSFLQHASFIDLLSRAEEEYGYHHPTGGLTIPCSEESFIDLATQLGGL